MKPKQLLPLILILIFILISLQCELTEPPVNGSLTLTLEDVSCTEAWLQFRSTNLQVPYSLSIKQFASGGDQIRMIINLNTADTLLYIDSLLPKQSYKFVAVVTTNNQQLTTNEVLAQTMDTTSHNFTWQT